MGRNNNDRYTDAMMDMVPVNKHMVKFTHEIIIPIVLKSLLRDSQLEQLSAPSTPEASKKGSQTLSRETVQKTTPNVRV